MGWDTVVVELPWYEPAARDGGDGNCCVRPTDGMLAHFDVDPFDPGAVQHGTYLIDRPRLKARTVIR